MALTASLPSPATGSSYSVSGGNLKVTLSTLNLPASGSPYYFTFTNVTFGPGTELTTSGGPVTIYATGTVTVNDSVTFSAASGTTEGTAEALASSNASQLRIISKSDDPTWLDTSNFSEGKQLPPVRQSLRQER